MKRQTVGMQKVTTNAFGMQTIMLQAAGMQTTGSEEAGMQPEVPQEDGTLKWILSTGGMQIQQLSQNGMQNHLLLLLASGMQSQQRLTCSMQDRTMRAPSTSARGCTHFPTGTSITVI
jgi:hypothetical protein